MTTKREGVELISTAPVETQILIYGQHYSTGMGAKATDPCYWIQGRLHRRDRSVVYRGQAYNQRFRPLLWMPLPDVSNLMTGIVFPRPVAVRLERQTYDMR